MARHVIPLDMDSALEMIWDDEAGTVEGDTVHAAMMIDERARGATLDMSDDGRIRIPATLDLSRDVSSSSMTPPTTPATSGI